MFNTTTVLHTSPQFDNFAGHQGAPTPYLQQPTTTSYETATHMFIRLISPKSVGLDFIVCFHFNTDTIIRTNCHDTIHYEMLRHTVAKITFCSVRVSQILLKVLKAHVYSH